MHSFWRPLALPVCLALLGAGCNNPAEGKSTTTAAEGPSAAQSVSDVVVIPVEAALPSRANVSSFFETTARVEAERRVDVMPQGMGECVEIFADVGDEVTAGQILAELDKEELLAQLRQTRVNVKQQENALRIAEEALRQGIGAEVERDNARFSHEQALATLNAQEVQLKNQTITSPLNGIVVQRNIQKGSMVTSAVPAFTIVDPSSYRLPINVPERELARLKLGQEARVTIDSNPGESLVARVEKISPSVDPMSGTVKVHLAFDDAAQDLLREAAFARVQLVMDTHQDALVVPKDTVLEDSNRKYLMVVKEQEVPEQAPVQVAGRVEVETGLEDGMHVEIVSGISDSTQIVTLGQHTLKEGARISVTNAEQEIASRALVSPEEALAAAKDKQMKIGGRDRREDVLN